MKKETKVISLITVGIISLTCLITIKSINNFNHKKEISKQQEIIKIENQNKVDEINRELNKLDILNLTIKDKETVEQLYKSYQNLDNDVKVLVDNVKLNKLYRKTKDLEMEETIINSPEQKEQLKRMYEEIKKLPTIDELTLDDALSVNLLIQQYNELSDENKNL